MLTTALVIAAEFAEALLPGRLLGQFAAQTFAVLGGASQGLRLTLKVCEWEVGQQDDGLLVGGVGHERDGGGAPRAPHGAGQRRLVDEVDHLVTTEALEVILIAFDAWQLLE